MCQHFLYILCYVKIVIRRANLNVTGEQITYLYRDKHQPLLLAIDEAQYLNNGILNDIKMLMNYGYDSVNCFTLILCGESHLGAIHDYSRGNPRLINNLMTDALTIGAQQECKVIDHEIILAAVNNQNFDPYVFCF